MRESGQEALGPFALYLTPATWIGGSTEVGSASATVWSGMGPHDVPLAAKRDGFIIFEFDQSDKFSGGSVPAYKLPESRRVPQHVTDADKQRTELAYQRFAYMNSFLFALHSAFSTVQHTGMQVQEPVNPIKYLAAHRSEKSWYIGLFDQKIDYLTKRHFNVEIASLNHVIELLRKCEATFGNEFVDVLSLLYISCHQYSLHQFASAQLIAWSVIEKILNSMWADLHRTVDVGHGGHTKMTNARLRSLNGRDYSASVISQVLSISGKIDDDLLDRLDAARKKRNAFAHGLEHPNSDDAASTNRLATDLLSKITKFGITSQLSIGYRI